MGNCPICGCQSSTLIGKYRNDSASLTGLTKRQCEDCEMVFVDPMPLPEAWDAYNASYFETAHGSTTNAQRATLFRQGLARIRVDQVTTNIGEPAATRVIEVGAGYGEFMTSYRAVVPGVDYAVVDTDAAARDMLAGQGATVFPNLEDVPKDRNLLVLSHVLEHTRDPSGFLKACLSRVVPGGHVFIDVPCRDDLYKTGDEPHLLFFDKPAMARLLGDLGLRDIEIGYFGETHQKLICDRDRPKLLGRGLNAARRLLAQMTGAGPKSIPRAEQIVLAQFAAEQQQPGRARWLRAMAVK